LSIFYPPAEYQTLKLVIGVEKENLFASAKVLKSLGYLEVMGKTLEDADTSDNEDKNSDEKTAVKNSGKLLNLADTLKKGDIISVNGYEIKESKTSPPKRYTSGSMILAMENAGQLIEDEELRAQIKGSGIGTSATRAEIIKKLIRIGYLNLNPKTQIITPMNFGEMVYEVVAMTVPALLNPQMTASWEKGLDGITKGTVDVKEYREKLEDFIRRETNHIKENDLSRPLANKISDFAVKGATGLAARKKLGVSCPICGGDIVQTPFGFGCSNYDKENENSCRFSIGKLLGKDLTEAQVKELLTDGRTSTIRGFKSKAGKKFDARVALSKDENGKVTGIKFDFEDLEQPKLKDAKCPICGGDVVKTQFGYGCSNYNKDDAENSCRFSINSKIAGLKMTDTIVKKLLADKKTDVLKGFTAKSGSKFDAPLKLNDEGQVVFDFPERPKPTETELICPRCKTSKLNKSQWYYECSCGFKVGHTVAQLPLPEDIVKELFETGKTKQKVTGFISKAGKPFETCLKFENEHIQFDFETENNIKKEQNNDTTINN
jgi:DNA topoisomerase-3